VNLNRWSVSVSIVFGLASVHCASSATRDVGTGATCPSDSTLTYATFGQPFMTKYCVSCHGRTRPSLSTQSQVKQNANAVMLTSASGPSGTNTFMPQDQDVPDAERKQLGEWLACGAP
jgi:hypothetical protein